MTDVGQLAADLRAEQDALDQVVAPLDDEAWSRPTPSPGWTVADQIAHLSYFDGAAVLAIEDADAFRDAAAKLLAADDTAAATLERCTAPAELLARWRSNRDRLAAAIDGLDESTRLPWYGPSMSAKSFLTARLMECWAHGQDVRDALALPPEATDRLRHVAQIGFITRGWSYANRGLEPPEAAVRVELAAPSGDVWRFGPDDATEVVRGPALDYCLVVTQRRHVDDTALEVDGGAARDWMEKAQAFAGRPTERPPAGIRP